MIVFLLIPAFAFFLGWFVAWLCLAYARDDARMEAAQLSDQLASARVAHANAEHHWHASEREANAQVAALAEDLGASITQLQVLVSGRERMIEDVRQTLRTNFGANLAQGRRRALDLIEGE